MTEEIVYTPTGFLAVIIRLDEDIPDSPSALGLTRAVISAALEGQVRATETVVGIGKKQTILLHPGKYVVFARLAGLRSDKIDIEITEGKVIERIFHFGTKPTF